MLGKSSGKPRLIAGQMPPLEAYDADIIILSFNRPAETREAIASALNQRGGVFHVTVLDQGSEPETLRALIQAFPRQSGFALYAADTNLGVAGGRNLATALGHGQIIIGLDNDAVFSGPWVVQRAVRAFLQKPDLGALAFNILASDGEQADKSSWGYPARQLAHFKERFDTTTFVGAGHAIRRATWTAAGGYDPAFFFTWEEYDFCLAAIALGWRVSYDGSLGIIHRASPESRVAWRAERLTYFVRNRLIIGRKWGQSWLYLAPRILGYAIKGLVNHRLGATLSGIKAAIATPPSRPRKMTKAMRRYLYINETKHRGSWLDRLRLEVFARITTDS